MKKSFAAFIVSSLLFAGACSEESRIDILDKNAPAPKALTQDEVSVEAIKGGAILTYSVSDNTNLMCIKAVYEINPGQFYEARGSVYVNQLTLRGFGSTETSDVKIYSVGRNGKESEPLVIQVTPLTPIVDDVYNCLTIKKAVGGVKIDYMNESEESLTFSLLSFNEDTQRWNSVRKFYSSLEKGQFVQRGLESVDTQFGIFVSDRWGNVSDTLKQFVTPIFEEEVPKPFAHKAVAGDNWESDLSYLGIECLWDGRWDIDANYVYATKKSTPLPQSFTIDLKHKVEITRIVEHQRSKYTYMDTSVKEFELYGTAVDNPSGDYNSPEWIYLGRFSSFQPSGQTGNPTEEDIQYGNVEGENFEFLDENGDPKPTPAIRYLRWRTFETWNGATERGEVIIAELEVFGKIVD